MDGGKKVVKLMCSACQKFEDKIQGRKNYGDKWIVGAELIRTSNIRDHAQCYQHKHVMLLLKKEQAVAQGQSVASCVPIVRTLHSLMMRGLNLEKKIRHCLLCSYGIDAFAEVL